MPSFLRSRALVALLLPLLLAAGLAGCASVNEWERKAIFAAGLGESRWMSEPAPGTEQFDVPAADGGRVHAWYLAHDRADAPTVLYLHGARWNLNGSVFRITRLHELGFNVLAIDYRGFGKSSPLVPSEASALADARLAMQELQRRQPAATRRFVYGHSLGGALAIDLAADPQLGGEMAGLIVESTFTSIPDVVRQSRYGWIPFIDGIVSQRFDSRSKIARVQVPLLIVHGTADRVVPHTMSDELYAAAGSADKRLVKLEGVSHSGGMRVREPYEPALRSFVQQAGTAAGAGMAVSAAAAATSRR